jgi:NAD-dependent deacetylase
MPVNPDALDRVIARLHRAASLTVLTGAGVSAASGVPTFRGPGGLWRSFKPEDLATPQAFRRDPALVWEWYDWRRQKVVACHPNRAHEVLAGWAGSRPGVEVITQNVDGLHERAGQTDVIRLHGSLWELSCWSPCREAPPVWRDETVPLPEIPPRCPWCHGLARPAVVWFGEALDPRQVARAEAATRCDVFMVVGTSSLVYPAAGLLDVARGTGAFTVEINPDDTPATARVDATLRGPAEVVLDRLALALQEHP